MSQEHLIDEDSLSIQTTDADRQELWSAAKDPTIPESLLRQMAIHADYLVRRCVADNPATPEDSLRQDVHQDKLLSLARSGALDVVARLKSTTCYWQNNWPARRSGWLTAPRRSSLYALDAFKDDHDTAAHYR